MEYNDGPQSHAKIDRNVGITKYELFKMFMTDEIIEEICKWTNLFAVDVRNRYNQENPNNPKKEWKPLDAVELRAFIGLIIVAGLERPKRKPWHEMWSKNPAVS